MTQAALQLTTIAEDPFELLTLLPVPPGCWEYWSVSLYLSCWSSNPGLHGCETSTLPTEPYFQPQNFSHQSSSVQLMWRTTELSKAGEARTVRTKNIIEETEGKAGRLGPGGFDSVLLSLAAFSSRTWILQYSSNCTISTTYWKIQVAGMSPSNSSYWELLLSSLVQSQLRCMLWGLQRWLSG